MYKHYIARTNLFLKKSMNNFVNKFTSINFKIMHILIQKCRKIFMVFKTSKMTHKL